MAGKNEIYVGVDLGGTKILGAVFDSDFKVLAKKRMKTPREGDPELVVAALGECVSAMLGEIDKKWKLAAVGVAAPGPLDRAKGVVKYTPNMGFRNFPLGDRLKNLFGAPAFLENDVQAGVYGEFRAGALKGCTNAVGIFAGTGIGGGIIINRKLYRGSTGSAGEVGHIIVQEGGAMCGCGKYGCLEAYASRTAVARDAVMLANTGKAAHLFKIAGADLRKLRSGVLAEAIDAGDTAIDTALKRSAYWLGVGAAGFIQIINPEAIVIGGGLADRFGERYLAEVKSSMNKHLMPGLAETVSIVLSKLGDLAVPTGAANIAMESIQ